MSEKPVARPEGKQSPQANGGIPPVQLVIQARDLIGTPQAHKVGSRPEGLRSKLRPFVIVAVDQGGRWKNVGVTDPAPEGSTRVLYNKAVAIRYTPGKGQRIRLKVCHQPPAGVKATPDLCVGSAEISLDTVVLCQGRDVMCPLLSPKRTVHQQRLIKAQSRVGVRAIPNSQIALLAAQRVPTLVVAKEYPKRMQMVLQVRNLVGTPMSFQKGPPGSGAAHELQPFVIIGSRLSGQRKFSNVAVTKTAPKGTLKAVFTDPVAVPYNPQDGQILRFKVCHQPPNGVPANPAMCIGKAEVALELLRRCDGRELICPLTDTKRPKYNQLLFDAGTRVGVKLLAFKGMGELTRLQVPVTPTNEDRKRMMGLSSMYSPMTSPGSPTPLAPGSSTRARVNSYYVSGCKVKVVVQARDLIGTPSSYRSTGGPGVDAIKPFVILGTRVGSELFGNVGLTDAAPKGTSRVVYNEAVEIVYAPGTGQQLRLKVCHKPPTGARGTPDLCIGEAVVDMDAVVLCNGRDVMCPLQSPKRPKHQQRLKQARSQVGVRIEKDDKAFAMAAKTPLPVLRETPEYAFVRLQARNLVGTPASYKPNVTEGSPSNVRPFVIVGSRVGTGKFANVGMTGSAPAGSLKVVYTDSIRVPFAPNQGQILRFKVCHQPNPGEKASPDMAIGKVEVPLSVLLRCLGKEVMCALASSKRPYQDIRLREAGSRIGVQLMLSNVDPSKKPAAVPSSEGKVSPEGVESKESGEQGGADEVVPRTINSNTESNHHDQPASTTDPRGQERNPTSEGQAVRQHTQEQKKPAGKNIPTCTVYMMLQARGLVGAPASYRKDSTGEGSEEMLRPFVIVATRNARDDEWGTVGATDAAPDGSLKVVYTSPVTFQYAAGSGQQLRLKVCHKPSDGVKVSNELCVGEVQIDMDPLVLARGRSLPCALKAPRRPKHQERLDAANARLLVQLLDNETAFNLCKKHGGHE